MDKRVKHGHARATAARSPEYRSWMGMRSRCTNPNINRYARYMGRGITMDKAWNDFNTFYKDMGPKPSEKHSLDRKDNNKGYCKENCRWATAKQQMENRCTTRNIKHNGQTLCATEWAKRFGIKRHTLYSRLKSGWTMREIESTPPAPVCIMITLGSITLSISSWAKRIGISVEAIRGRIRFGWSLEKALTTPGRKQVKKGTRVIPPRAERNRPRPYSELYTFKGETLWISEWARRFNIKPFTLRARLIVQGLSIKDALTKPLVRSETFSFNGKTKTVSEWAKQLGLKKITLWWRIKHWPLERALTN